MASWSMPPQRDGGEKKLNKGRNVTEQGLYTVSHICGADSDESLLIYEHTDRGTFGRLMRCEVGMLISVGNGETL